MRNQADIGKHYERRILALISLKCVLDENIEDFWIKFNSADVESFNDIILHVTYNSGQKELFLMHLKHKISQKPIVAKNEYLKLDFFQKAFKKILENNTFFKDNNISEDTRKFFVLYDNSKIVIDNTESRNMETDIDEHNIHGYSFILDANSKLQFEHLVETDFRAFLNSKSFAESTGYKLNSREHAYDQDFLDNFYFFPEQLNLEEVEQKIEHLSGLKNVADDLIHFFDEVTKPTNETKIIKKLDVKIQILSIIFGNFQPSSGVATRSSILQIVNKFSITVISDDYSKNVIWNEILLEMRNHCREYSLELSNWQDPIQNLQEKFGCQTRTKDIYFRMVARSQIPFYINTDNILYPAFLQSTFPKLRICVVVFNSKKEELQFPNSRVFETLRDFDKTIFQTHKKSLHISFNGKSKVPLLPMVENDNCMREKITADLFIKLESHSLLIEVKDDADSIYINRTLEISMIREDILGVSENILFIICNFPLGGCFKKFKNNLLKIRKHNECFQQYINVEKFEHFRITDQYCNVITTTKPYNTELVEQVINSTSLTTFHFLQYVDEDEEGCRFTLINTNGKRTILKPHLSETTRSDIQLVDFSKDNPVNFICNEGGMGKSMLLKYLLTSFPPYEWVIYAELGKYRNAIDRIKNFDDFMNFFYDSGLSRADSEFGDISRQLYQHFKQKGKLTLLLDDCDEIMNTKLLNFLKEASNRGMKLWIAARPGVREQFENTFEIFAMELSDFTIEDQTRFFRKFFHKMEREKQEINRKLRSLNKVRDLFKNSFIGNCQLTMMLAVVFNADDETSLEQNRVDDLYKKFINLKINDQYDKNRDFILQTLSKLALAHFFSKAVLQKIFDWSEFQCDIEVFKNENPRSALVSALDENNYPEFTHKTYAEFLAGHWFAQNVRKQIEDKTPFNLKEIVRLLYLQEFTNVRLFFDSILTETNPLFPVYTEVNQTDVLGRNFLHIFFSYSDRYDMHTADEVNYAAVRVLQEHPQIEIDDNEILVKVPNHPIVTGHKRNNTASYNFPHVFYYMALEEDKFLNINPIECALVTGCLKKLDNFVLNFGYVPLDFSTMKFNKYFMLVYCIKNQLNHILRTLENVKADSELLKVRTMTSHMSLLHMAVESVNLEAVKLLSEAFPLKNWGTDSGNNTPLHYAFHHEYSKALTIFQQCDLTSDVINLKNSKGYNHLHCAVQQKNVEWTKLFLSCPGVEVDAECSQRNTPFMLSVINNKLEIAKLLKDNKADINHKNKKGWTALHFTASKGLLRCTQQLAKWGIELNTRNSFGETPLIRATISGKESIVKCLLEHNAEIDASDNNERTALHHATKRKKISILRLLLEKNAKVDAANKFGNTPLTIACLNDVPEAVGILLDYHASVDYRSRKGTALEIAVEKNHNACTSIIEKKIRDRNVAHDRTE